MKNKNIFFAILIFTLPLITGCGATPVPYSFAENESGNGTAEMIFTSNGPLSRQKAGVDLHYFEDTELPIPDRKGNSGGKYWSPIIFPAGRPLTLIVNVFDDPFDRGNERTFNCPALVSGGKYKLEVEVKPARVVFGVAITARHEKIILKDAKTGKVVYEQQL